MSQPTNTAIVLKVKFMSSDTEGWDYMKGRAEMLELEPTIILPELSDVIKVVFAIPDGKAMCSS